MAFNPQLLEEQVRTACEKRWAEAEANLRRQELSPQEIEHRFASGLRQDIARAVWDELLRTQVIAPLTDLLFQRGTLQKTYPWPLKHGDLDVCQPANEVVLTPDVYRRLVGKL